MKYVMAFTDTRGPLYLRDGSTREDVALACRETALAFMEGVRTGWDKVDLALWLTGPYARATRWLPRGERSFGLGDAEEIAPETIEALLVRTRQQLLAPLEKAVISNGVLELADEALPRHLVRRAIDHDGNDVFVPVDVARMRLRDRLCSLFSADYLDDPAGYLELFVCHRCEAVVFDARAKSLGICGAHRRVSGFIAREDGNQEADSRVCSPERARR